MACRRLVHLRYGTERLYRKHKLNCGDEWSGVSVGEWASGRVGECASGRAATRRVRAALRAPFERRRRPTSWCAASATRTTIAGPTVRATATRTAASRATGTETRSATENGRETETRTGSERRSGGGGACPGDFPFFLFSYLCLVV